MTYDLYDLILDLTEAGFTVQFEPMYADDEWTYKPSAINISIRNDNVTSRNGLKPSKIRELGQDVLVEEMIGMTKYCVRRMEEAMDEPSTTQGRGPTE